MPRESAIPIDLPSLDDLFTTQAERDEVGCEKVGVIPLYMIDPFPDHPFRVDDDALRDMAERLVEAQRRGLWQEPGAYREALENLLLDVEEE